MPLQFDVDSSLSLTEVLFLFELELRKFVRKKIHVSLFTRTNDLVTDLNAFSEDLLFVCPVVSVFGSSDARVAIGFVLVIVGVITWAYGGGVLVSMGLGLILNEVLAPTPVTPAPNETDNFQSTPSYNISAFSNKMGDSNPVPIVYGVQRVAGTIIDYFEDTLPILSTSLGNRTQVCDTFYNLTENTPETIVYDRTYFANLSGASVFYNVSSIQLDFRPWVYNYSWPVVGPRTITVECTLRGALTPIMVEYVFVPESLVWTTEGFDRSTTPWHIAGTYRGTQSTLDIDPTKPFTIYRLELDAVSVPNKNLALHHKIFVTGTSDLIYSDKIPEYGTSINNYGVLLGLCEGPIQDIGGIQLGGTNAADVSSIINYSYTQGTRSKMAQDALIQDPIIVSGAAQSTLSIFSSVFDRLLDPVNTEAGYIPALSQVNGTAVDLSNIFQGVSSNFIVTAGTSLNFRGLEEGKFITLDPLINDDLVSDTSEYVTAVTISLNFLSGLYAISPNNGKTISKTVKFGIKYYTDANATIYSSSVSDPAAYISSNLGATWATSSPISEELLPITNYYEIPILGINKAGLRIQIKLTNIPLDVRKILLFRVETDAFTPHPQNIPAIIDTYGVSACEISRYQFHYKNMQIRYPGTALLALSATANSALNNTFPTTTVGVRGLIVDRVPKCRSNEVVNPTITYSDLLSPIVYSESWYGTDNAAGWTRAYTTNPVWCLFDILTNKSYGLGNYIGFRDLDIESFFNAAKWCDDPVAYDGVTPIPRYTLNIQIEMHMPPRTVFQAILQTFRGVLFWRDGVLVVNVDKSVSVSQVLNDTQLTNLVYSIEAPSQRNNAGIFTFQAESDNFEPYSIYIEDTDNIRTTHGDVRETAVNLTGVTNELRAISLAKYNMYVTSRITKRMTFTGTLDLLTVNVWDVIRIHTAKFLNTATYGTKIKSITFVGNHNTLPQYRYTVALRTPVQLSSEASGFEWSIQSTKGGAVAIYPAIGSSDISIIEETVDLDTDTYEIDIWASQNNLHTLVEDGDSFTIFGTNDIFEDWRIVGITVADNNTVRVSCINYDDTFYNDLDVNTIAGSYTYYPKRIELPNTKGLSSDVLELIVIKNYSYFDEASKQLRFNVQFSLPNLDNISSVQRIIISGGLEDGAMYPMQTINSPANAEVTLINLIPGTWRFLVRVDDLYGRTYLSTERIVELTRGNIDDIKEDKGNIRDTTVQALIPAPIIQFPGTDISINWATLPRIITSVQISYTSGLNTSTKIYSLGLENEHTISQPIFDFLEISGRLTTTRYNMSITYYDVYGYQWTDPTVFQAVNPRPSDPPTGMFSESVNGTVLTVRALDSQVAEYVKDNPDFTGITIVVSDKAPGTQFTMSDPSTYVGNNSLLIGSLFPAGSIVTLQDIGYDPESHSIQAFILDLKDYLVSKGQSSATVRVYVFTRDFFGQRSNPVLLGFYTIKTLEAIINQEILPGAIGNTLSTNLLRNSSFEE